MREKEEKDNFTTIQHSNIPNHSKSSNGTFIPKDRRATPSLGSPPGAGPSRNLKQSILFLFPSDDPGLDHHSGSDHRDRQPVKSIAAGHQAGGSVVVALVELVGVIGVAVTTVLGRAERALGLALVAIELDLTGVPVNGDREVVADLLGYGAGVAAALAFEGGGAARAAEELATEDQRAVVFVDVGGRAGVLDVKVSTGDGLGHGDNSAELEDPGLHDE